MSEVRTRLNSISMLEGEALTKEISAESETLQSEYKELEVRNRAAIVAENDDTEIVKTEDAEIRELKKLTAKSNIGDIFSAAVEHRNTSRGNCRAATALRHQRQSNPDRNVAD